MLKPILLGRSVALVKSLSTVLIGSGTVGDWDVDDMSLLWRRSLFWREYRQGDAAVIVCGGSRCRRYVADASASILLEESPLLTTELDPRSVLILKMKMTTWGDNCHIYLAVCHILVPNRWCDQLSVHLFIIIVVASKYSFTAPIDAFLRSSGIPREIVVQDAESIPWSGILSISFLMLRRFVDSRHPFVMVLEGIPESELGSGSYRLHIDFFWATSSSSFHSCLFCLVPERRS